MVETTLKSLCEIVGNDTVVRLNEFLVNYGMSKEAGLV